MNLHNPILKGFNPDPSIIRVGEDYYIATSTFEWFPGVQIHHSKNLVDWQLVARPLNRLSQLDMRGVPDSGGVWAPCLSYDKGTYYLVYSNVHSFQGIWKDTPNYLVTTNDILGDWSEPIYLSSAGFDGSLFHDEDGRKWYLSMIVDHRKGTFFGGIILQEYDPQQQQLVGPVHHIYPGSDLGCTEGPHLYQKDGYYYLVLAEGGTEYNHAVSVLRSKNITGPYELHPDNPIVTAVPHPNAPFQRTGHGDLVQAADGNWYLACLASRPLATRNHCILGRETVLEEISWPEGQWPSLKNGTKLVRETFSIDLEVEEGNLHIQKLPWEFQSLRIPITDDWCEVISAPNHIRLYGQESLSSLHRQSLLARRVQAFHIQAQVSIDFSPNNFQQMAGMVCYYNTYHWHYLHIMGAANGQRQLQIISCDKYQMSEALTEPIDLPNHTLIHLKIVWNREQIQCYYALTLDQWKLVGPKLDGSILSDDYVRDDTNRYRPAFTGAFIGICCQDLSGQRQQADFLDWSYVEI